ncbi:HAD-IIIA family hydrolase [Georgenia sp. SUBG003]|uniref:HAD-IIIA family hydrolase n=1 Tax=Georgenia sp. SUBG003 TaxID=1497974 RepID=UPI003AB791D3
MPYNADPGKVRLVDGAADALRRLRGAGLATGLVTNQSGVARGLLTEGDVRAVNARLLDEVGGLDTVQHCPHGPDDGCACRKPGPLMVLRAAAELGVAPYECAVVGDIGADVARPGPPAPVGPSCRRRRPCRRRSSRRTSSPMT